MGNFEIINLGIKRVQRNSLKDLVFTLSWFVVGDQKV